MDPIDKYFKSMIKNVDDDGMITIRLHYGEISALMECLDFARIASTYLKDSELRRGTQNGVRRMMDIERDSKTLFKILSQHLEMGEPENDLEN